VNYIEDIIPILKTAARVEETPVDAAEFARTRLGLDVDARQVEVLRSDAKRGF